LLAEKVNLAEWIGWWHGAIPVEHTSTATFSMANSDHKSSII